MTKRNRIVVVLALALVAATVASRFTTTAQADFMGNLNGNVGPGSTISLSTPEGAAVSSLGPGTYAIHVTDTATNHNFHLEGSGVNLLTSIEGLETVDWTVELAEATYVYRCDRHASLTGSFVSASQALVAPPVTAPVVAPTPVPPPVPVAPPPPPPPAVAPATVSLSSGQPNDSLGKPRTAAVTGTLRVTLTAKNKLVVTKAGKPVTDLDTGTYAFVVTDSSKTRDVTLRKLNGGKTALTTRAFKGTKTVRLDLFGGTWKLFSATNEKGIFALLKVTD